MQNVDETRNTPFRDAALRLLTQRASGIPRVSVLMYTTCDKTLSRSRHPFKLDKSALYAYQHYNLLRATWWRVQKGWNEEVMHRIVAARFNEC